MKRILSIILLIPLLLTGCGITSKVEAASKPRRYVLYYQYPSTIPVDISYEKKKVLVESVESKAMSGNEYAVYHCDPSESSGIDTITVQAGTAYIENNDGSVEVVSGTFTIVAKDY